MGKQLPHADDAAASPAAATADEPWPSGRLAGQNFCGTDASLMCGSLAKEEPSTIEDQEDSEWIQRQQRTGTVCRLVQYRANERPKDDLLLRGGSGRPIAVAAVR